MIDLQRGAPLDCDKLASLLLLQFRSANFCVSLIYCLRRRWLTRWHPFAPRWWVASALFVPCARLLRGRANLAKRFAKAFTHLGNFLILLGGSRKRTGRDSNPRCPFEARTFSKGVLSTTQPPILGTCVGREVAHRRPRSSTFLKQISLRDARGLMQTARRALMKS